MTDPKDILVHSLRGNEEGRIPNLIVVAVPAKRTVGGRAPDLGTRVTIPRALQEETQAKSAAGTVPFLDLGSLREIPVGSVGDRVLHLALVMWFVTTGSQLVEARRAHRVFEIASSMPRHERATAALIHRGTIWAHRPPQLRCMVLTSPKQTKPLHRQHPFSFSFLTRVKWTSW